MAGLQPSRNSAVLTGPMHPPYALISNERPFRVPFQRPRLQSEIVMRKLVAFFFAACLSAASGANARADILITVDKSSQRMTVSDDGRVLYNWPVSTGKTGHATPSGSFRAFRMEADHYSKEWDDAPMPYSIFFTKVGHAIHGTSSKNIGMPVSHGCVRLSVAHAQKLYAMVQQEGVLKTKVVLTGSEQIALKRNRTMIAEREDNPPPQEPQYRQEYRQDPREQASPYGEPQDSDPRYADRRYDQPRYVYPNYNYGERPYRRQPQYMEPQYTQPDPYRNRSGIY